MALGTIVVGVTGGARLLVHAGHVLVRDQVVGRVVGRSQVQSAAVTGDTLQSSLLLVVTGGTILHRRQAVSVGKVDLIQVLVTGLTTGACFRQVKLVTKVEVAAGILKGQPGLFVFEMTLCAILLIFHVVAVGAVFLGWQQVVACQAAAVGLGVAINTTGFHFCLMIFVRELDDVLVSQGLLLGEHQPGQ